jgi:Rod binding domain-containing protein
MTALSGITAAGAHAAFMGPSSGTKDAGEAAREFAGLFYSMMISEMQKTIPQNGYFASRGEEVFRSVWINETGREMASRRSDALAAAILKSVKRHSGETGGEKVEGGNR